MSRTLTPGPLNQSGPAWDIARLFPEQGLWQEGDYLELNRRTNHLVELHDDYADGADLVMEVVSDDRRRDLEIKPKEYAQAGIPEYWIVDPRERTISVLRLAGSGYAVHGEFKGTDTATSSLLPGFEVALNTVFKAAAGRQS